MDCDVRTGEDEPGGALKLNAALASEASGQRGNSFEVRAPDTRPQPGSSARAAVNDILQTPDVRQRLDAVGFSPNTQSLDGVAAFLRLELDNWGRMVKAIGLTIR
jgi:hypothetical protein